MAGTNSDTNDDFEMEELSNKTDTEQAEAIAEFYAKISNEYDPIENDSIPKEAYKTELACPHFEEYQVYHKIMKMNARKSTVKNDIPMKIIKEFSAELSTPLAYIFNHSMQNGQYPDLWKIQIVTPAPKCYPAEKMKQLRPISGLKIFGKIAS